MARTTFFGEQIGTLQITNENLAGSITLSKLTKGADIILRDGTVVMTADFDMGGYKVVGAAVGTGANDLVTYAQMNTAIGAIANDLVEDETPTGLINGSNTSFTLANTPIAGSVKLYLQGQRLIPGAGNDFTVSGTTITMAYAPETNQSLRVDYRK